MQRWHGYHVFERILVGGGKVDSAAVTTATHIVGAFNSTTKGYATKLLRSGRTAVTRVYSDDGGVVLTGSGSVPDIRTSLSRFLVTTDHSGGHVRLFGVMGQIKSYDGEWGNEQVGAVHGYLELVRNAGTINFQNYGVSAGVMATVESSGTMTVDANHILAGVAAISKLTSGLTQTGITAGVYVGIYNISQWSDGTARSKWKYGLLIDEDSVDFCPIAVGEFVASAATGGGFVMTQTNSAGLRVYAEDGAVDMGSATFARAILGRSLISGNYTQQAEVGGVVGQVVLKQATVNHNTGGVWGSWEAQATAVTITGTSQDNIHAGVLGRVGVTVTGSTVSATGVLAGLAAMSNITDGFVTITTGGILAGLHIGRWASKQKWQYGIYVDEDSVDYCPIAVGKFVSAAASGGGFAVTLTNSAAVRVYAETTSNLTSDAMVRAILGRMLITGNFTQTAEVFGVVGQCVIKQAKVQHDLAGVLGSMEVQSTAATFSGDIGDTCAAAVLGRVGVTVTGTAVEADGVLAGLAAMSNITNGFVTVTAGGVLAGVYVGRFASKQVWDAGVYIDPTACTIPIQIGVDGAGAKVVIVVGNFADNGASGYGKGSLGIDTTDGVLFVADSSGNWQLVTVT